MEWAGAKKFIILLLVILNVGLAGLNFKQNREGAMTATQERAIFEVLSKNGITMYTDLTIEPTAMYRLEAEVPVYTKEALEQAFFAGEKTRVTPAAGRSAYTTGSQTLVIEGDRGIFTDESIVPSDVQLDRSQAISLAENKMQALGQLFGSYALDSAQQTENGWQVVYCSRYRNEIIFSNRFVLQIMDGGISEIAFTYCNIRGQSQEQREICMSDEALLVFMREWKKEHTQGTATIQKVELGYDLSVQGTAVIGAGLYLEPCYGIYLMEETTPYLVNAYTCQIVKKG